MSRPTGLEERPKANVIGYFRGEFGVAQAARALVRAAGSAGVETALIGLDAPETARANDHTLDLPVGSRAVHPVNILCVNADQTEHVAASLGKPILVDRHNVGLWFWELAGFPAAWAGALDVVDEVWVASDFVRASVSSVTEKPVRTIPVMVDATPSRPYRKADFGLPEDAFVFLFTFDFNSYVARKNPAAIVSAFQAAFATGDTRTLLILKSTNGSAHGAELEALRRLIGDDQRIELRDGFLSRDEVYGLMSAADSYISLHRAEGFGLGLAESMFLGKPVIGTAYSGNMQFMDPSNSCLIGYSLVAVEAREYPHSEGQVWAEPDLDHAAYWMRRLVEDTEYAQRLGRRAAAHVQKALSAETAGAAVANRLREILDARAALTATRVGSTRPHP